MTTEQPPTPTKAPAPEAGGGLFRLSLDWWAVIVALILVALVLLGVVPSVPW